MTRHHRLGRMVATLLALGIGVGACGSADAGVSSHAARSLHDAVRSVRVAAAVGDHDAAVAATRRLETQLAAQRADGRVSADADARIRRAIARVRSDLVLIPTTTTSTTTTTTTTTTTAPVRHEHGEPHGKGHEEHGAKGG